jgi:hypothetical protein
MSDLFHNKEAKPLDMEISESDTSSDSAKRSDGDSASDSASDRRDSASDGDSASDIDSDTAQVAQAASNWGQLYTPSPENNGALGSTCLCGDFVPDGKSCAVPFGKPHRREGKPVKRRIWCEAHARHYNKDQKHADNHVLGADNICRSEDCDGFDEKDGIDDNAIAGDALLSGPEDHEGGFLDNSLVGLSFQPQPTPNLDNAIVSTQNHPRYSPKVVKSIHL